MIFTKTQKKQLYSLWDFYKKDSSFREKVQKQLEKSFNYKFKDPCLLFVALTHSSAAKGCIIEGSPFYERLEFLGDSVLSLCISDVLLHLKEGFSEGDLSKIRSYLVREEYLFNLAISLGLSDYVLLGKSINSTKEHVSILADIIEAILGAIYLDSSFSSVFKSVCFIYKVKKSNFKDLIRSFLQKDYKTLLQEYIQETFKVTPVYKMESSIEKDGKIEFTMGVYFLDKVFKGKDFSKKEASQKAAEQALIYYNRL